MLYTLLRLLGAYTLYEKWLYNSIKRKEMPTHIAVILDGNRRWASYSGLNPEEGYRYGAQKVEELLNWCLDLGIKVVTLYALSLENMQRRKKSELEEIYRVLIKKSEEFLKNERVWREKVRFKIIGRKWLLPYEVRQTLEKLEIATNHHNNYFLNIAVAYGGRAEIVDALRKICVKVLRGELNIDDINERIVEEHLYTNGIPNPHPDLVIRTSGEERISNFLLWQVAYSELVFLDVYWPEFRKIDFLRAIRIYQRRERRMGA
ncbi:MAG: polyprenyl diphosphate synthase [Nitrososphaerota archaeon]